MLRPAGLLVTTALLVTPGKLCRAGAAEPVDLLKAFQSGSIRLTLFFKDHGRNVDLLVENLTQAMVTISIGKGKTPIDLGQQRVFLISAKERKFRLPRAGVEMVTLPLEQEVGRTWTSGTGVMLQAKPPPETVAHLAAGPLEVRPSETLAHLPVDPLEVRLPTIAKSSCKGSLDSLEVTTSGVEYTVVSLKAQNQFRKTISEFVPKPLVQGLTKRRRDFRQLYEETSSGGGLSKAGEQVLREFSKEAQGFTEELYRAGEGRAVTPLMAFTTSRTGEVYWCLFYLLIADAAALGKSPAFTTEMIGGNGLFVMIVGRDIDRARVGTALTIGWGPDLSLQCGHVSPENLPSARR